jgi:hypothetical protein
VSNAIGTNIQSKPDQNRASKDVTITLPKAVAKANNRSSITAAQKVGRAPKRPKPTLESALESAPEPALEPTPGPAPEPARGPAPKTAQKAPKPAQKALKPAQKAQKPAPKASIKRKRAEVEDGSGEGEEPSPHRLRSRQY